MTKIRFANGNSYELQGYDSTQTQLNFRLYESDVNSMKEMLQDSSNTSLIQIVDVNEETQDEKVLKREVQRLETSIKSALAEGLKPIVFLHYPPIFATNFNYDILEILYRYNISDCYYGHIHGRSAHDLCIKNTYDGINFHLIAGDYLQFIPEKIL